MDYIDASMEISFPEQSMDGNILCINVSIVDDTALEGDETFTVSLTVTSGGTIVGNNMTTITIIDNDGSKIAVVLECVKTLLPTPSIVTISVPAEVMVSEGVADGTAQVCAAILGASPNTMITSAITATVTTPLPGVSKAFWY